jgi:hypothetical protein
MILKIYKISRIIFFTVFSIISIYATQFYEGSILIFGCYCFFLLLTFFYLTNSKSSYFEIFFSSYLFLGFWFKYIFSLIFYNGIVFDSGQIKSTKIDEVLILTILITFVCLISSFINKKFINIDVKKDETRIKSFCENFYLNNRNIILIIFILLISFVGFFNNKLGIFQRGFIYLPETSIYINNFIKWLLLFGFTTFSCFVIHIEILNYKKINIITVIISFFEIFISYTSMLSRSFIINSISLILPIYQKSLFFKKAHDKKFIFLFIVIIFLTPISLYVVNNIRLSKLYSMIGEWTANQNKQLNIESPKDLKIKEYNFQIPKSDFKLENLQNKPVTPTKVINFILINRWIGIDSLIVVNSFEKKNFDLFFQSLREDKNNLENTFYEKTFNLSSEKLNIEINQKYLKGNTLPGIISFLYYSGSIYFLLISLFIIFILCNSFERLIKKITQGNAIFACFLSNMIATRLIHFGYAPKDTYLFILSILLSILLMIFLLKFIFSHSLFQK